MTRTPISEAGARRVTIYEVASACGLSTATVSKALSGQTRNLSMRPETLRLVREAAERLGYKPNMFAQSLRRQQSRLIGISHPAYLVDGKMPAHALQSEQLAQHCHAFGLQMIGVTDYFHLAGYKSIILPRPEDEEEPVDLEQIYFENLDGLLYLRPSFRHQEYLRINEAKKNIVLIGRCPESDQISNADIDNFAEGQRLTKHLINSGARQVGLIMPGSIEYVFIRDRHLGYQNALREAGYEYHPEHVLFRRTGDYFKNELLEFLHGHNEIDALVVGTGILTEMVIEACRQLNRHIPHDLLLASFDVTFKQQYVSPTITSIEIPYYELVREGGRILIERIKSGDPTPVHTILPATLVIRESSIRR